MLFVLVIRECRNSWAGRDPIATIYLCSREAELSQ
jgi:hypothetical protein